MVELGPEVLRDLDRSGELEWLEATGTGGWASSTVAGCHSRRYHGLLVAALEPPASRVVVVSKLDETLHLGHASHALGTNRYPGVVEPRGFEHLVRFERGLFPVFDYAVDGVRLRKTVAAIHGENTVVVAYEVLAAPAPFTLELRPFLTWREGHHLGPDDTLSDRARCEDGVLRWIPLDDGPELTIAVPGADFEAHGGWYHRFSYEIERRRGFDFSEDLWTPGLLLVELTAGDRVAAVISLGEDQVRDGFVLLERERARRTALLEELPRRSPAIDALALAADQFVVRRGAAGRSLIAGYHWFADWGRDAMISLAGLCLTTHRHDDARGVLRTFAGATRRGLVPNRFADDGDEPEYSSVDAGLWLFVAVGRYLESSGDLATVRDELLPVLEDIVGWYDRGTGDGIRVAGDGLLAAGDPSTQLTWMDARVDGIAVTPRHGKAVEVNALWVNALGIVADLLERCGRESEAPAWRERAAEARHRFGEAFWDEAAGALYDVVRDDGVDAAIRPNQILALALPHRLLDDHRARRVLRTVESRLLTPFGLRSLDPADPAYRPTYQGDAAARDGAYHQGTVWGWLLGPFITALVRYRGEAGRAQARELAEGALAQLHEAGVGTCSEIFDGDPPHAPRGCIAQAWSVAELLRVLLEETV